jgi:hypothetical protein
MRKFFPLLVLVVFSLSLTQAQEDPIPPKRSRMIKVGLFGGFTPGLLFADLKPVNDFLVAGKATPLSENGIFMAGGSGAAYIMLVPNLRVGGVGMSGSQKSTSLDAATGIRRDAQVTVGYGGVTVEYVLPIAERFDFAFGTMLGAGGMDITLRQYNGGANTWGSEQTFLGTGLGTPGNNVTRTLSGSFFIFIPSVSFEYALLNWMAVRLGGSYVGMLAPSWKVDGNFDLINVPGEVSGRGFMVNAGLLIGTF